MKYTKKQLEVREKDADFVQRARELSDYFFGEQRLPDGDPRSRLSYWLGLGHKVVLKNHRRLFNKEQV